jgi:AbrB family looped-hinge helix DNA binding protein
MTIAYATVRSKGRVVIPLDVRRKCGIDEGTRVALQEEDGRLLIQPLTDAFIEGMKGILAGRGLPDRVERSKDWDRPLRSVQVEQSFQQKKHSTAHEDQ